MRVHEDDDGEDDDGEDDDDSEDGESEDLYIIMNQLRRNKLMN